MQALPSQTVPGASPGATTSSPSKTVKLVRSGSAPSRQLTRMSRGDTAAAVTAAGACGAMTSWKDTVCDAPPVCTTVQVPLRPGFGVEVEHWLPGSPGTQH